MAFDFSRISKTNLETSVEYLQKHFLNQSACFFRISGFWDTMATALVFNFFLNLLKIKSLTGYVQNMRFSPAF